MSRIIIGSERSEIGLPIGMQILRDGGSALDAVEAAMVACENNLQDPYVGTGGLPNAQGEVELDASLMVGSTRAVGAVGAIKNFPNPISVARAVLERLPQHSLLVGAGAELFAADCGFSPADLLTEQSKAEWRDGLIRTAQSVEGTGLFSTPGDARYRESASQLVSRLVDHRHPWGTINIIAIDETGEVCSGASTSGYPWKHPGRLGDTPLPGVGNYADGSAGAAACTGRGELSMRVGGAFAVVNNLRRGDSPVEAGRKMISDSLSVPDEFRAEFRVIVLSASGEHAGLSTGADGYYVVMEGDDVTPQVRNRVHVS